MKTILSALLLSFLLPAALPAASPTAKDGAGYRLIERSPTAKPAWKAAPYAKGAYYYAAGKSSFAPTFEAARLEALKDASAKAAEFLERRGIGRRVALTQGVEEAANGETLLAGTTLGKVKVEAVVQERWQAPDGKEAWSARLLLSIRRKP